MPIHAYYDSPAQFGEGREVRPARLEQVGDLLQGLGHGALTGEVVGHVRSVRSSHAGHLACCSCGWTRAFDDADRARTAPCEIERLLTESAERLRRWATR